MGDTSIQMFAHLQGFFVVFLGGKGGREACQYHERGKQPPKLVQHQPSPKARGHQILAWQSDTNKSTTPSEKI